MDTGFPFLDTGSPVLAFAHRGGAAHPDNVGLENTRRAFAVAWSLGFRYFETDVHLTRDGVLLAFHDAVLERVSDGTGRLADLTYAELSHMRIGGTEAIPTLLELVEAFPGARFNIDLKAEGTAEPLAALIAEHGLQDRILVGSFSARRLNAFRRLAGPRVPTAAHPAEVAAYLLLPGRLATALTRGRVAALQIPYRRGPLTIASRRLVRRAHAANLPVHVWTIDDPVEMETLLDRGVDGLMTDRTDILRAVLERRGLWRDDA
jgi:glycerophosphoryl diester phosphodiesterase